MLFTLHWKSIVQMPVGLEQLEEWCPSCGSLLALHERSHIADQNDAIAGAGDQDVESFRGSHEANITGLVAAGKRGNHNIALFTLIVVCFWFFG